MTPINIIALTANGFSRRRARRARQGSGAWFEYRQRRARRALRGVSTALAMTLCACSAAPQSPLEAFEVQTPRPFGYVLGDELERRIHVAVRDGFALQPASLPATGSLNRRLDIKQVTVGKHAAGNALQYDITVRYQVFYAPLEVKILALPGFTLAFERGSQHIEQRVPDWHFSVSPLRELAVRKDGAHEYLRPDAAPPPIDTGLLWLRFNAALLSTVLAASLLAYRYGYIPGLSRRRIFKQAARRLVQLPAQDAGAALAVMHGALNTLNHGPLFAHRLADFYRRHPAYAVIGDELQWFFGCSDRYFFGGGQADAETLQRLKNLCRLCRDIERGSR